MVEYLDFLQDEGHRNSNGNGSSLHAFRMLDAAELRHAELADIAEATNGENYRFSTLVRSALALNGLRKAVTDGSTKVIDVINDYTTFAGGTPVFEDLKGLAYNMIEEIYIRSDLKPSLPLPEEYLRLSS
jgi:hypothetical protein